MRAHGSRAGAAILAALLGSLPTIAAACAVCGGNGNDRNRVAFLLTTLVLSLLPLALVGGVVVWLWRRSRSGAAR